MKRITKDNVIYSMNPGNTPALYIEPGETILFETWDALHGQVSDAEKSISGLNWERVNPATGPVYINNALPGDILSVKIEKIDVEETGVTLCGPGMGVMGKTLNEVTTKIMTIKDDLAYYNEKIQLPLNKMIGVIGVAPKEGDISNGVPDLHGGNMDCKEVTEGATILLPVNVPGALLALGDLHAIMADGEISVTGLEVGGEVTATIDVIKKDNLPLPMIENENHIMTLASDEDLDIAVEMAASKLMFNRITRQMKGLF